MTRRTSHRRLRALTAGVALAAATGLALPSVATAEPAPPTTDVLDTLTKASSADPVALAAARAIAEADGGSPSALITGDVADDDAPAINPLGAYDEALEMLRELGIQPFLFPSISPFCSDSDALPLGVVPAVAGAVPGPWPGLELPIVDEINLVEPGETLFAFVPAGIEDDGEDTGGMQLAWFNINTFQGGFADMGTVGALAAGAVPDTVPEPLRDQATQIIEGAIDTVIPFGGVRAVPVDTGSGTVLSAAFGTIQNGENSCFFLPTIGITDVE